MRRTNTLLRDLLDAASIDAGHLAIAPRTPATDIAYGTIFILRRSLRRRASRSRSTATSRSRSPARHCDTNRIQQALGNLLGNAIKFTPRGGAITVKVEAREHEVRFCVADTGPGISADASRDIFDRFWRGSHRDVAKGVGLGLFIAKGIVEAHGGKILGDEHGR